MILAAVRANEYDPIRWVWVTSLGRKGSALEGYTASIPVMADALQFSGIRVTPDYRTSQRIADHMGALLMTPYVDALTYEQADLKPSYTAPQPVSTTTADMVRTSQLVDQKIKAEAERLGNDDTAPFAGNTGKNWVLTKKFWEPGEHPKSHVPHSKAAANHGLYLSPWHPIQNVGVFHPLDHTDDTQTLRLMAGQMMVRDPSGEQTYAPTKDVLMDAFLAPLLTGERGVLRGAQVGEGPLPGWRHPAIPLEVV